MTLPRPLAALFAVLLCAPALPGCLGGDEDPPAEDRAIKGRVLTIYSSLPAEGPSAGVAEAVAAGQRQALADAHGRAGRYRVRLVQLSSSKLGTGVWDPGQVSENASRAAQDPRAIAYLGELNLGASAVSVPVTNKAGILQVSPGDGLTSLTRRPPGRSAAGPERYYPSEHRTFVGLVPADVGQADLIVGRLTALGLDRPALVIGAGVYARELAGALVAEARAAGIEMVETKDLRDDPEGVRDLPRELAEADPDSVILSVARDRTTAPLLAGLGAALPQAKLLTGSGVLVDQPLVAATATPSPSPLEAVAPEPPAGRQAVRARRMLQRIARGQGLDVAPPAALWGYESMRVALDAIDAAQSDGVPARRRDVVREALTRRVRHSPIGTYEILPTGAVEGVPLALYRLDGDRFEWLRTLQ